MEGKKTRLEEKYKKEAVSKLKSEFSLKNNFAIPRIEKIVVNTGIGEAVKNKAIVDQIAKDFSQITGQKPSLQKARISVATFGVRKGMVVGLKTTLRGERMYFFLDKLISIVLPRLRDFRGLSLGSFDQNGNYTLGFEEQSVFPEIDASKISKSFGLEVTIVTGCRNKQMARRLLELLGMPFEKGE